MKHEITPERWQQIERLYHSALEHDISQRGAFLQQACAGDDALREEVESLLAHEKTTDGLLNHSALGEIPAEIFAKRDGRSLLGTKLGSYQVLTLLGKGGMGEVYQAHDSKLRRDVAIKVLPAAFVNDPERLSRFEREARMLASLNHPNIATIHGLEQSDGVNYLVMELVPGHTLAEQVRPGPVPIKEALAIARQIAEALEAAHERGVIHRDLKPANVKVTPEGKVKVLDFGLAKAFASDGALDPSQSPTLTGMVSEEGRILGTPAYMSPEQARGKPVDKRTDIWAFGCVLYELLTAKQAFRGETTQDTIAAVLGREPDWQTLPLTTPTDIRRLLHRCLEKNCKQRLHDIADARLELDDAMAGDGEMAKSLSATSAKQRPPRWRMLAGAAIGALATAVALFAIGFRIHEATPSAPGWSTAQTVAAQLTNYGGTEAAPALSPDGKTFVFVSDHGGTPDIWLRQVSGGEPVRLTNDAAEESDLAFSPDGDRIYFTRIDSNGTGIWQIGALGGQAQKVLDGAQKPAPSHDGRNLAYITADPERSEWALSMSGLYGGSPRMLVRGISPGHGPPRPAWSFDGRWIAYSAGALLGPVSVFVVDVKTGQQREITRLPPGGTNIEGQLAWLPDNRHLIVSYVPFARQQGPDDLGIIDVQAGSISRLTTTVADSFHAPSVSADGSRLIAMSTRYVYEVWKVPLGPDPDANGRAAIRLLDDTWSALWTYVSRDGRTLLFNSPASGSRNLWTMPLDGSRSPRQITAVPGDAISHSSLSPDGTHIAFASIASGHSDIWTENVDGSDLRQLTNDEPADSWPVWSPDGRWIVFTSQREGRQETWRVPSAGGPAEKLVDGFFRGDWFSQPTTTGTWIVSSDGVSSIRLLDVERRAILWDKQNAGGGSSLPMFSPDGRFVSAPFRETRDHDAVRIFEVATGKSRLVARLPFHAAFRASWADNGNAFIVNRGSTVSHIVLFDRFWDNEREQKR